MADTEAEIRVPAPDRSARRAWTAVIVAVLIVVSGMVALESINRAMVRFALGRDPADWTDYQVRALLQVHNVPMDRFFTERSEVLRKVARMRPSGEVTAHALWQVAMDVDYRDHAGRATCLRRALEAAPDDSPRLSLYFGTYAREMGEAGKLDEIVAACRETLRRTMDMKVREGIVSRAVYTLDDHGAAGQAADLYEEAVREYPEVAAAGGVRLAYAKALESADRVDEARTEMMAVIATGDESFRERARESLRELDGGDAE